MAKNKNKIKTRKSTSIYWLQLIGSILLCEGAGILSGAATASAIPTWYQYLNKPFFSPPSWVFGPVWTVLYALMGISLYLVWQKKQVSQWFWAQLLLNMIWSLLFFGLRSPGLAFLDIIAMLVAIVATIKAFWKVDRRASYLLMPYLAWVSFASILNFAVWILNR